MVMFLIGAAAGIVAKILIPMPFLDDPVRNAWRWVKTKVTSV